MPQGFYYRIILIVFILSGCGNLLGGQPPRPVEPSVATLTKTILPAKTNGFDPQFDGFSFRNYGFDARIVNLLPDDVLRLFGADVCIGNQTTPCILIPSAQVWMQEINRAMQTGHCEGMAVLSQYFYYGILSPDSFGAAQTAQLTLVDNPALQREIAYWWATQATFPTRAHRTIIDAKSLLATLAASLDANAHIDTLFTVGMYQRDFSRGHTVTPIGMHYTDATSAVIELYDNNIPNAVRAISVDVRTNSWSYTAPSVDGTLVTYSGDATSKNLELTAAAPRMEKQFCHFCPSNPTVESVDDLTTFFFSSSATTPQRTPVPLSVYFVDALKRRVGIVLGVVTNEIPGATISFLRGADSPWSPLGMPTIAVPPDVNGTLNITGIADTPLNISSFGPGAVASVENLLVSADSESTLLLDQARGQVAIASTTATQPNIVVGYTEGTQNVTIVAESVPLLPDGALVLQADKATNGVSVYGSNPAPIRITTSTRDIAGVVTEQTDDLPATDATLADALRDIALPSDTPQEGVTPIGTQPESRAETPATDATPQPPTDLPTVTLVPTEPAETVTPTEAATFTPEASATTEPTTTVEPTERRPTRQPYPSATPVPLPTDTITVPTQTTVPTPSKTHTATALPTETPVPAATETSTPAGPTDTPDPLVTPSETPLPTATTALPTPTVTRTRRPTATTPPPSPTPWWCDWSNLCFRR